MREQPKATHPLTGETVYRWWIIDSTGRRRLAWAPTEEAAMAKASRRCTPVSVMPAGDPLTDR